MLAKTRFLRIGQGVFSNLQIPHGRLFNEGEMLSSVPLGNGYLSGSGFEEVV
jgi:hypothetical protein